MTHGNGSLAQHDYDDAGRISAVRNLKSDGSTVLSIFTYSYDDAGNRTGVVEANGDRVTWSYDEINQLTLEARSGANAYGLEYTYDAVGNRLTQFNGAATFTYTYDAANQLTLEENPSARITYSYDANGNTEGINAAGSLTTYSWDVENHMTLVELSDATLNTMTYDGDGKRRQYEDSAGLRKFVGKLGTVTCFHDVGGMLHLPHATSRAYCRARRSTSCHPTGEQPPRGVLRGR
jgi:YD repeat-containing protein